MGKIGAGPYIEVTTRPYSIGAAFGAPVVPGNPDGLNAAYQMEYPEGIHLFGMIGVARTPIGRVSLEATFRANQPVGFNGSDLLAAFTSRIFGINSVRLLISARCLAAAVAFGDPVL